MPIINESRYQDLRDKERRLKLLTVELDEHGLCLAERNLSEGGPWYEQYKQRQGLKHV